MGGGGGLQLFSVSPRPLGFGFMTKGFGAKGLGPGLDNKDPTTELGTLTTYTRCLAQLRLPLVLFLA
mgnify:CR=1 FL=1